MSKHPEYGSEAWSLIFRHLKDEDELIARFLSLESPRSRDGLMEQLPMERRKRIAAMIAPLEHPAKKGERSTFRVLHEAAAEVYRFADILEYNGVIQALNRDWMFCSIPVFQAPALEKIVRELESDDRLLARAICFAADEIRDACLRAMSAEQAARIERLISGMDESKLEPIEQAQKHFLAVAAYLEWRGEIRWDSPEHVALDNERGYEDDHADYTDAALRFLLEKFGNAAFTPGDAYIQLFLAGHDSSLADRLLEEGRLVKADDDCLRVSSRYFN